MSTSTTVNDLKINVLTKAQYDTSSKSSTELWMVTDDTYYDVQVDTLPTADASCLNKIYQYTGTTDANYTNGYFYKCKAYGGVTISQTAGNTLSNLSIDVEKFLNEEQPSSSETINFTCSNGETTVNPTSGSNYGLSVEIINANTFWAQVEEEFSHWGVGTLQYVVIWHSTTSGFKLQVYNDNPSSGGYNYTWHSMSDAANCGLSFSGTASGSTYFAVTAPIYATKSTNWKRNNIVVDIQDYGISYTGTPVVNDIITVVYSTSSTSYAWTQVNVQSEGSSLPSQTGNAGKFLTTDGTDASWATVDTLPSQSGNSGKFLKTNGTTASWANALTNTATGTNGITIASDNSNNRLNSINIGKSSQVLSDASVAYGNRARVTSGDFGIAIGDLATVSASYGVAISGNCSASYGVQLGQGTNSKVGTLHFGTHTGSSWVNYEVVSRDGTIPEARLADTTSATSGQVLQLDSNLNAVWATPQAGSSTLSNLTDVTITSASSGQVLSYNGTNWENSDPTPAMVIVDYTAA